MLRLLCSCFENVVDKDHDGEIDFFQVKNVNGSGLNAHLDDILKENLLSVRGRRERIRNIALNILPTKFEDDDEPPNEDEDDDSTVKQGMFMGQNYERIREKCYKSGTLYVDPLFPPCNASLYVKKEKWDEDNGIEWKRASEICQEPKLFVDGASRFDIKQGELGDCWLLAAMANLTLHKKLFFQVVPLDQSFVEAYTGVFHFRIWQYGEWTDVVVDDYLPTRNGRLLYIKSASENEFWSALLEKAYAKLHGCYEALKGGSTCEAMVDFSGGCSEIQELGNNVLEWEGIYKNMRKNYERCTMIACYINADPNVVEAKTDVGLIQGHAYSVTKVVQAKIDTGNKQGVFPLVRVRNPWGNEAEWKGAWSDGSKEWQFIPEDEKLKLGLNFEHDGEFYMSQNDFMSYFEAVEMTHLMPGSLDDDEIAEGKLQWNTKYFEGSWVKGVNAGGCRNFLDTFATNPQYLAVLEDSDEDEDDLCTCIISLMQKGTRKKKAENQMDGCLTIGFVVYLVRDPDDTHLPLKKDFFRYNRCSARSKTYINSREISERFKIIPGTYVIIPTTFDPDETGNFLLRIFAEKLPSIKQIQ